MANSPNTFRDTAAITAREAENTTADFDNGMNNGSCAPGIGVNLEGGDVTGEWDLLDQFGAVRVPQVSQVIGGLGITTSAEYPSSGGIEGNGSAHSQYIIGAINPTIAAIDADPTLAGTITVDGTANLQTLVDGWVKTAV
jgi:hypothetical protein